MLLRAGRVVTTFGPTWATLGVVALPVGGAVRVLLVLVAAAGAVIVAATGLVTFVADAGDPTVFAVVDLPAAAVLWATTLHLARHG